MIEKPQLRVLNDEYAYDWRLASCHTCELGARREETFCPSQKPKSGFNGLMIVGEGPGATEARLKVPFIGRSGQLIDALLKQSGLDREQCWTANATSCMPPPHKESLEKDFPNAIPSCLPRLDAEIFNVRPRVILALGQAALTALTGKAFTKQKRVPRDCSTCKGALTVPWWKCPSCKGPIYASEFGQAGLCEKCMVTVPQGTAQETRKKKCPECEGKKTKVETIELWKSEHKIGFVAGGVFRAQKLGLPEGVEYVVATYHPAHILRKAETRAAKSLGGQFLAGAMLEHVKKAARLLTKSVEPDVVWRRVGEQEEQITATVPVIDALGEESTIEVAAVKAIWEEPSGGTFKLVSPELDAHLAGGVIKPLVESLDDARVTIRRQAAILATQAAADFREYVARWQTLGARDWTLDIETDTADAFAVTTIKCVGITADNADETLVLDTDGKMRGDPLVEALCEFLEDAQYEKVGQNFVDYDSQVIWHLWSCDVANIGFDTLIAHHAVAPDEPHDLQHIVFTYTDAEPWKPAKKEGGIEKFKSKEELHSYNCLHGNARVLLPRGQVRMIAQLVRERYAGNIVSYDEARGDFVERKVVGWTKAALKSDDHWVRVQHRHLTVSDGLVCTADHPIYTQRGWLDAADLDSTCRMLLPERGLTRYQEQAMLGSLLGDASLAASPSHRNRPKINAPMLVWRVGHAAASKLSMYKKTILGDLVSESTTLGGPTTIKGCATVRDDQCELRTCNRADIAQLSSLVYDSKDVRRLRVTTLELIGPVGWAWWFMDDGCRQNGSRCVQNNGSRGGKSYSPDSVTIATCGFPRRDIEKAAVWFRKNFGPCSIDRIGVLRLSRSASLAFCEAIAPHVPDRFRYKFPRDASFTSYRPPPVEKPQEVWADVTSVRAYTPTASKSARALAKWKWCLTVEGTQSFFTTTGLVHNSRDVHWTRRSRRPLETMLAAENTEFVAKLDLAKSIIARNMSRVGLPIDPERHAEWKEKSAKNEATALDRMREVSGLAELNPNAPAQLVKVMFDPTGPCRFIPIEFTDTGAPSTNIIALTKMRIAGVQHPFLDALLEFREWSQIKKMYFGEGTEGAIDIDWRLRARWNALGARTGRWSCSPNCFSADTEILTPRGWVRFDALSPSETVAQWSEENGISWVEPTGYVKSKYVGDMIHLRTEEQIDMLVTPDHRCLVRARRTGEWKVVRADEYPSDHLQFHGWSSAIGTEELTEAQIALLCATQADGNYASKTSIRFKFRKERKIQRLRWALGAVSAEWVERDHPYKDKPGYVQREFIVTGPVATWIRSKMPEKCFEPTLLNLSPKSRALFCDEVFLWDGNAKTRTQYMSTVRENVDLVQAMLVLNGERANASVALQDEPHHKLRYYINAPSKGRNYSLTTNCSRTRRPYADYVYCVSVPSTFIVTRRAGRVAITGNCMAWPADLKAMVKAPPGWKIVGADMPAAELRITGALSGDKALIDKCVNADEKRKLEPEWDPHSYTASFTFPLFSKLSLEDPKEKKARAGLREVQKTVNYAVIYGGSDEAILEGVFKKGKRYTGPPLNTDMIGQAKRGFFKAFSGVNAYFQEAVRRAMQTGYVRDALIGRTRIFPMREVDSTVAQNYGIQSTVASMMDMSIVELVERLPSVDRDAYPIIQEHDFIGVLCREEKADAVVALLSDCMSQEVILVPGAAPMPFPVKARVADDWAELK